MQFAIPAGETGGWQPIPMDSLSVLVADDQTDVLQAIRLLLKGAGHTAETVDNPAALLQAAQRGHWDVILMDMNYARDTTSGHEGLEVLRTLRARHDRTPVIVMTAWGSLDLAVEAMRQGASDFVQKPWDNARLLASIAEQAERGRAAQREKEEAEIARNVQRKLLPDCAKPMRTIDCAARCLPAREVGGDYYDFIDLGPGRLGIVVADVSGKGVAAALLMANLQALFRTHTELTTINRLFCEATPPEQYATVFSATYNETTRQLHYVNCGHPAAVLRRAGGETQLLEGTATVVGLFPDWECEQGAVRLDPGDTLVIYSDGVAEFAEEMVPVVDDSHPELLADRIASSACDRGQTDDVTVVVVRGKA